MLWRWPRSSSSTTRSGSPGPSAVSPDYEIAQGLATTVPGAELFVYPGTEHLFAEHDEQAAALLRERVLEFLG
jgi:hypothetical protein